MSYAELNRLVDIKELQGMYAIIVIGAVIVVLLFLILIELKRR